MPVRTAGNAERVHNLRRDIVKPPVAEQMRLLIDPDRRLAAMHDEDLRHLPVTMGADMPVMLRRAVAKALTMNDIRKGRRLSEKAENRYVARLIHARFLPVFSAPVAPRLVNRPQRSAADIRCPGNSKHRRRKGFVLAHFHGRRTFPSDCERA